MIKQLLEKKIKKIQARDNFNPEVGTSQVIGLCAEVQQDFGKFSLLLDLISNLELDIKIPYSKDGIRAGTVKREKKTFVYFAQRENTNIWKIGYSNNPEKRCSDLQTGNDGTIWLKTMIPGGRLLEKNLKNALRKFKSRDKNHPHKGEWFKISVDKVKEIVRYLLDNEFEEAAFKKIIDKE